MTSLPLGSFRGRPYSTRTPPVCAARLPRKQQFVAPKFVMSPHELFKPAEFKTHASTMGMPGSSAIAQLAMARFLGTYSTDIPVIFDWRMRQRLLTVEPESIARSFESLEEILETGESGILLADLYAKSCKAFEDHDHPTCLVMAWNIIERCLKKAWSDFIARNRKRDIDGASVAFINTDRRDKLEGADFTASIVGEMLSLMDLLPFEPISEGQRRQEQAERVDARTGKQDAGCRC